MAEYKPIPGYEYYKALVGDRYFEMRDLLGVGPVRIHITHLSWREALDQIQKDVSLIESATDNAGIIFTIIGGLSSLPSKVADLLGWSASKWGSQDPSEIIAQNPSLQGLSNQQIQEVWDQVVKWLGPDVVEPPAVVSYLGFPCGVEYKFSPHESLDLCSDV